MALKWSRSTSEGAPRRPLAGRAWGRPLGLRGLQLQQPLPLLGARVHAARRAPVRRAARRGNGAGGRSSTAARSCATAVPCSARASRRPAPTRVCPPSRLLRPPRPFYAVTRSRSQPAEASGERLASTHVGRCGTRMPLTPPRCSTHSNAAASHFQLKRFLSSARSQSPGHGQGRQCSAAPSSTSAITLCSSAVWRLVGSAAPGTLNTPMDASSHAPMVGPQPRCGTMQPTMTGPAPT